MRFHPKGFYSINATLLSPGGPGAFPGQVEPFFLLEADPTHGVVAGYVAASEFLAQYEPGVSSGKPGPNAVAERAAVDTLVALMSPRHLKSTG